MATQHPLIPARAGIIPAFTGISAPYEAPITPRIAITTADSPAASLAALLQELGL